MDKNLTTELPQMVAGAYTTSNWGLNELTSTMKDYSTGITPYNQQDHMAVNMSLEQFLRSGNTASSIIEQPKKEKKKMAERRVVKVFIVDNNKNIPLDKAIVYQGAEKFTDATNEELFFEIPIREILEQHNDLRIKTIDKKSTRDAGKDIYLEPIRIRDLKMVVTTIAEF